MSLIWTSLHLAIAPVLSSRVRLHRSITVAYPTVHERGALQGPYNIPSTHLFGDPRIQEHLDMSTMMTGLRATWLSHGYVSSRLTMIANIF